jgi:hemerythrin-like domain-containing protein
MLPIGPLMIEHRLIERMIEILNDELNLIRKEKEINPVFIDNAVDFIRTYADQTHHGKEEDILFRELLEKEISGEHKNTMEELIEEHKFARKTTGDLVKAKEEFMNGNEDAINTVIEKMQRLVDFYPNHIDKEDNHFFKPVMDYFTKEEQDAMLKEGQIFDRRMIHRKYNSLVKDYESNRGLKSPEQDDEWINFM